MQKRLHRRMRQLGNDSDRRVQDIIYGVAVATFEAQPPPLLLAREDKMVQAQGSRVWGCRLAALDTALVPLFAQLIPPLP